MSDQSPGTRQSHIRRTRHGSQACQPEEPQPGDGAANEWQTKALNDFETRKAAGEDPATLAYAEVVDHEFRFMKAIPTAAVCLGCHGTNLSPAVTAKLTELYPQDQATGYKEGDLRGAFVAVKKLAQ